MKCECRFSVSSAGREEMLTNGKNVFVQMCSILVANGCNSREYIKHHPMKYGLKTSQHQK
jgi:hypothetical protein